jgi:ectoine hydroxylase-related dioxygenase (phytanoyl-CoA dioxygenase family)
MLNPLPLTDGRLSPSLTKQYWADGYLFPLPATTAEKAAQWRADFEEMERNWLAADLPLPLNSYKRLNAQCVMPLAFEIASDPSILDQVEGILGPDILLYSVEFFVKEARTKHVVTMHQDLTYWGMGAIDGLVTAWVPLSPATPASGCMDFVSASHKNPILPHQDTFDEKNLLSRGQEIAVDVAEADKVAIELHPGQMSLHHGLTIHGSGPNISDDRRIAAAIRYLTPVIAQDHGGQDSIGNFMHYEPAREYFTKEGVALHDKLREHQSRVTMAGAKAKGIYKGAKDGSG